MNIPGQLFHQTGWIRVNVSVFRVIEANDVIRRKGGGSRAPGFRKGNIRNLLQRKAHQLTAVGIDLNSIKTQKHPIRFNRIPAFFKI